MRDAKHNEQGSFIDVREIEGIHGGEQGEEDEG